MSGLASPQKAQKLKLGSRTNRTRTRAASATEEAAVHSGKYLTAFVASQAKGATAINSPSQQRSSRGLDEQKRAHTRITPRGLSESTGPPAVRGCNPDGDCLSDWRQAERPPVKDDPEIQNPRYDCNTTYGDAHIQLGAFP